MYPTDPAYESDSGAEVVGPVRNTSGTFIYYEAKTGAIFLERPRERNVYRLLDTRENRTVLSQKQPADIAWLEDRERIALDYSNLMKRKK